VKAHLIMGHGVSWCFGTRLAPEKNRGDLRFTKFR